MVVVFLGPTSQYARSQLVLIRCMPDDFYAIIRDFFLSPGRMFSRARFSPQDLRVLSGLRILP